MAYVQNWVSTLADSLTRAIVLLDVDLSCQSELASVARYLWQETKLLYLRESVLRIRTLTNGVDTLRSTRDAILALPPIVRFLAASVERIAEI